MLKLLYIVSLFIAVFALDRPKSLASESDIKWSEFENFVNKYSKTYDSEEEIVQRYRTFSQRNILHSSKQRHSLFGGIVADSTAMVEGITRFSDLTKDEFVKKHLTYHLSDEIARDPSNSFTFPKLYFGFTGEDALPEKDVENFDWRKKNVVSSVKDQGTCDNCFVIGSLGNIESAYAIKYGKLYDIDNESFFSCKNQTYECTKGTVTGMFESAKNDGVPLTADCAKENIVKIKKWVILASDEEVMKKYVRKIGPITISFNGEALHTYERGIIEDGCNGEVNHVGLIVGYGVSGGKPFWIVKNSWGADNGENGYFRVLRGKNTCSITTLPAAVVF